MKNLESPAFCSPSSIRSPNIYKQRFYSMLLRIDISRCIFYLTVKNNTDERYVTGGQPCYLHRMILR